MTAESKVRTRGRWGGVPRVGKFPCPQFQNRTRGSGKGGENVCATFQVSRVRKGRGEEYLRKGTAEKG